MNQIPVEASLGSEVERLGSRAASFEASSRSGAFSGSARTQQLLSTLAQAAITIDRARSALPLQDPGGALETWRAFVDGRFALVASFDCEGRHFMILRACGLGVCAPAALTPRERQVVAYRARGYALKYIAYELGLTASTISCCVASARSKLGLRSDVQLIATFSADSEPEQPETQPELSTPPGLRKSTLVHQGTQLVVLSFLHCDFEVPECLSEAERYVLGFLLGGEPMAKIAARRGTSLHTVCNQVASIYRKVGVGSRAELVSKLRRTRACHGVASRP